ncbi:MAG: Dabb family protein [Paracoccaceae bacterium]
MSVEDSHRQFIRHVVFFSAKRKEDVDRIVEGLSMLREIPDVGRFEVSRNRHQDGFSNEVDVVVYAEFRDDAAMQAYRAHPVYKRCIDIVRPLRDVRMAADF